MLVGRGGGWLAMPDHLLKYCAQMSEGVGYVASHLTPDIAPITCQTVCITIPECLHYCLSRDIKPNMLI